MNTTPVFTAAQLATGLNRSVRGVRKTLKHIRPTAEDMVRGQRCAVWSLAQLPDALRGELAQKAAALSYRDVAALLAAPPRVWQPPVALAAVSDAALTKARNLRAAFAGTVQRLNDLTISEAEFRRRGLADFHAGFGYAISEKQWQRLLDRTTARDGGAEDWQRLEIYLDEKCARPAPAGTVAAVTLGNEHRPLRDLIASFKKPAEPTKAESLLLWQTAFDRYDDLVAEG